MAKKPPTVKVKKSGSCEMFSTMAMRCPLCDKLVPPCTPHACTRTE